MKKHAVLIYHLFLNTIGHHPDLHLVGWNNVTVEIWTHSVGMYSTMLAFNYVLYSKGFLGIIIGFLAA